MKILCVKNCLLLNFISLLGYLGACVTFAYILFVVPEIREITKISYENGSAYKFKAMMCLFIYFMVQTVLSIILAIVTFTKIKSKHKMAEISFLISNKIVEMLHLIFFLIGIFLVFIPCYFLIYILLFS